MLAGRRVAGNAMHQKIAAVRMMSSVWLTEDVQVNREPSSQRQRKGSGAVEVLISIRINI